MPRLVLLSLWLLLTACHSDRQGAEFDDHQQRWSRWAREARQLSQGAMELQQRRELLRWDGLIKAASGRAQTLRGDLDQLVSRQRLIQLYQYENTPLPGGAQRSADESLQRREVRYLRHHLALLWVQRRGLQQQDRYLDQLRQLIAVGPQKVRTVDLANQIGHTADRAQRQRLHDGGGAALRRLEQLLRRQYWFARQESRRLGLSLYQLMEGASEQETPKLLHQGMVMAAQTKVLFAHAWAPLVVLTGGEAGSQDLGDLRFLQAGWGLQQLMDEAQQLPALQLFLGGIKLEPGGIKATGLGTSCVPVSVPTDVRVAYRAVRGLRSYVRLFEAAGEAACRAQQQELPWVFRAAGPQLGAQALKYLLGLVWLERGWWRAFNTLRSPQAQLSAEQIEDLGHAHLLQELVRIRVQGVIIPAVRVKLEGGPPAAYAKVWSGEGPSTPAGLYRRLMGRQLGLRLRAGEALAYIRELDGPDTLRGLVRPFDLRAYVLAYMALERVRGRFGAQWYTHQDAGPYLIKQLCTRGSAATAQDLARQLGSSKGLDYTAPVRVLKNAWSQLRE